MQGQSFNYKLQPNLKNLQPLIRCMFSEYSGSLNGRNAYDKGFLIAIQAKRYKIFLVQVCPIY